ncbi:hypothetical protein Mycch_2887 [Mycolicibacterium chubuense NBB4]|uniref:Secreted protein n=1 Tax=Mycolicibacterium chubuense (strain NBB4) TaxID=710421 RepID=I4BK40_MYCCN|nr:hypothetical protein [Mycolicibacterium chubuense]AFM17647.1 hypothetical protein Mycch_2887 [Mycolicibacterium chubuense NBB4]
MRRIPQAGCAAATVVAATVSALTSAGAASAEAPTAMPFAQKLRRCDFSQYQYVGGSGYARPSGQLRREGSDVVADVQLATGLPNTPYDVRVIQMPRASAQPCNAGDPGVAHAVLFTDGVGGGAVALRGAIMPGATGAWISVTRPGTRSQQPDEFYTTDLIAAL